MPMKKDWKYYTGIALFVWSFAAYGILAAISAISIPASTKAIVAGILVVSAEGAFFLSILLLGKTFVTGMKEKLKAWFGIGKKKSDEQTEPRISRTRHYTGVFIMFFSFVPYIVSESLLISGFNDDQHINIVIGLLIAGDILFVASLFVLGGEFWDRLKKLFVWHGELDNAGNAEA
jgi:hypothetical protein